MIKIQDKGKAVVYFDVDETLVMWHSPADETCLYIANSGYPVKPHKKHVERLIEHASKGDLVIVWSQSGVDWCESVVKALDIEKYVDVVISKPEICYDDLPMETATGSRRYLTR